jgi:hypothetical protein
MSTSGHGVSLISPRAFRCGIVTGERFGGAGRNARTHHARYGKKSTCRMRKSPVLRLASSLCLTCQPCYTRKTL